MAYKITAKTQAVLEALDRKIAEKHLLKHPFYQTWTEGKLPMNALREYACQYYKQVEAFPRYLGGIYSKCEDMTARRIVLQNLIEEDHGSENHPELWLRFAEGIGVDRDTVMKAKALPETQRSVETLFDLTLNKSCMEGMAAIYAYEAMVPEVAEAKIAGLKQHYDVNNERTLSFFTVHEAADRIHREMDKEVLARVLTDDNDSAEKALNATDQALNALWTLLDGVHSKYVVNCN